MRQDAGVARPHAAQRLDRLPTTPWLAGILTLLFLSWFVESYDIGLTGAVLPSLTHQYHLSTGMKSVVSVAANAGIVIGIVPAGRLADRFGRKPVLVAGTLGYSVLTFLTGLAPSLWGVVTLRVLAGLAMGAVFPLPYIFGSELCSPNRRARLTGLADSFLSVGYFVSPLLAIALIPTVDDTTGWRVMFMLGGIPALFALLAWRYLPESPRWSESKGRWAEAEEVLGAMERRAERATGHPIPPVVPAPVPDDPPQPWVAPAGAVFRRPYLRRSVMLWITFGGTFFIFYSIQTFMPTVVSKMGFTLTSSFAFTSVIVAVSIPGKLFESWVVERWGRKPVIVGFTALAAVASVAFGFARGAALVLILGCVMSFLGIGVDPAVKAYTAESYPTEMRGWGTSTTEGFGRLISGVIGPALIPVMLDRVGVASVYVLVGAVALVAATVALSMGHETRGLTLEQSAVPQGAGPAPAMAEVA